MDRYAVIGNPVAHSRSPEIHAAFAAQTGQDLVYERLLAPLDGFSEAVRAFRASGGLGMNVTVPFKLEASDLATRLTQRAALAGAVNTLKFEGARLHDPVLGDNTDGIGLVRDLARLGARLRGARLLLLGAGGAARGVIAPLLDERPASLTVANRTVEKAESLAAVFAGVSARGPADAAGVRPRAIAFSKLVGRHFDVVVNATSAGLADAPLALPDGVFRGVALAYDMMYGAAPTAFLSAAADQGAALTADGLGMLVEQAAESFYLWRGVRPDTAPVLEQLRAAPTRD